MARFAGWTEKAILELNNRTTISVVSSPQFSYKKQKHHKDYITPVANALKLMGVESVLEYKFLHDRRFRFDLAIPSKKVAVEFEGGIFSGGRHTRGKGYARDVKKYNLAVKHGWKLHRVTCLDAKAINWEFAVAKEIIELIGV